MVALATSEAGSPAARWDVFDLGCGTGLLAPLILPFARSLVGVDLSRNMLAAADARGVYQRLVRSDLLEMMGSESACTFDAILAADVFVYLGRLDGAVAEARRLLRPSGVFAFSVESLASTGSEGGVATAAGYALRRTGRYAHGVDYLNSLAVNLDLLCGIAWKPIPVSIRVSRSRGWSMSGPADDPSLRGGERGVRHNYRRAVELERILRNSSSIRAMRSPSSTAPDI